MKTIDRAAKKHALEYYFDSDLFGAHFIRAALEPQNPCLFDVILYDWSGIMNRLGLQKQLAGGLIELVGRLAGGKCLAVEGSGKAMAVRLGSIASITPNPWMLEQVKIVRPESIRALELMAQLEAKYPINPA